MSNLTPRQLSVVQRLEKRQELQPLFFKKAKGLIWFDELYNKGYFDPKNNPAPVPSEEEGYINIPKWQVIDYLVSTSYELENPQNENYAKKFLELMRATTIYARNHAYSNHRTWYNFSKIIRNIPPYLIDLKDLDWVSYWLDDPYETTLVAIEVGQHWLPKLLSKSFENRDQFTIRLLDILYEIRFNDRKYGDFEEKEAVLRFDLWHAMEITKRITRLSGTVLGLPALSLFRDRLATLLDTLKNDKFSFIWRPAIEDHDQNQGTNDAEDVFVVACRDCSLGVAERGTIEVSDYFRSMLECRHVTLKRIAIHAINNYFDKLKTLVASVLLPEYFQSQFQHELSNLLKNHYSAFGENERNKVLAIIEDMKEFEEDNEVNEKATAYKKMIWLKPIRDFDGQALELYNKYLGVIAGEPEHPEFASYMTVGFSSIESPISRENLLSLDSPRLVKTVNSYEDPGEFGKPGLDGLVQAFKSVVKERAEEFSGHLPEFAEIKFRLIWSIIESFRELWNEKKELPWEVIWPPLLEFSLGFTARKDILTKDNGEARDVYVDDSRHIISEISQLIKDGTRSDEHAFDKSLIPKAHEILDLIVNHQKGSRFESGDDAVNISIYSPLGHAIEAVINLTLRSCRLADKGNDKQHAKEWLVYKPIYESGLKRSAYGEYEFVTLIAYYLPNFLYISRDWTLSKLPEIFDKSNDHKWLCAMQGYSYVTNLYDSIYDYLKNNGDFLKALDNENVGKDVFESVLRNAIIFFFSRHEDITDPRSIISVIIERRKYEELRYVVWYVWTLRNRDIENIRDRVFTLWPRLLDIINFNNVEGKKLASQLCRWVSFVDKIDTNTKQWLLQIAPYSEVDYNTPELLTGLATISDSQPIEAQEVWLKMLDSASSVYPPDAVERILRNLIKLGPEGERKAVAIVDSYLKYGEEKPGVMFREAKATVKPTEQ